VGKTCETQESECQPIEYLWSRFLSAGIAKATFRGYHHHQSCVSVCVPGASLQVVLVL